MIKRRICGPRNVVIAVRFDPAGQEDPLIICDPAVDAAQTDFKRYAESLYTDISALSLHEDKPSVFRIRPLSLAESRYRQTISDPEQAIDYDIQTALISVTDYVLEHDEGPQLASIIEGEGRLQSIEDLRLGAYYRAALSHMIARITMPDPR